MAMRWTTGRAVRWVAGAAAVMALGGCAAKGRAPSPRGGRAESAKDMAAAPSMYAQAELRGAPGFDGDLGTESYERIDELGFRRVADFPLSTFSIDVDTASYSNVRRFLTGGALPPPDAVRIEELVNYFDYGYDDPSDGAPFSVTTEVSAAPWAPDHQLVHIGLQGKRVDMSELPPKNLVFLLDVSGSMEDPNKLPLLKQSLLELLETLDRDDRVAIVVYAGASGLVLPSTSAATPSVIAEALERLQAGGSTNGGEGIQLAYAVAREHFQVGGINRVILATDGDFNVGLTSEGELTRLIEREREHGVFLTVLGFGMGNYKDSTLESLADRGNGAYAYIDTIGEARKVLIEEAGGTFLTIAKDVKIQLELNPAEVSAYRLIGYENRMLADTDFVDDTVDAGEIGAGHTVTALYELVPADGGPGAPTIPLRYGAEPGLTPAAGSGELFTIKVRYKEPTGSVSRELVRHVPDEALPADRTSERFRFSAAVASFGMLLRGSEHAGAANYRMVRALAESALGGDARGYRREFLGLVATAEKLAGGTPAVAR